MSFPEDPAAGMPLPRPPSSGAGAPVPSSPPRLLVSALLLLGVIAAATAGTLLQVTHRDDLGVVTGPPDPRGFRPARVQADTGEPVRFDPCSPIHYVINPALAPAGGVEDAHTAVQKTAEATGMRFVYDGVTDEVFAPGREPYQPDRYGERWAPVLVGWASGVPAGDGAAADTEVRPIGLGGGTYLNNDDGRAVYVTGSVTFDATAELAPGFGGETWGQVMLHELGHVVGLGHVEDPRAVMNPVLGLRPAAWGEGDRAGLWELGIGGSCLRVPSVP